MLISVSTAGGEVFLIEISPDMNVETLKILIAADVHIPLEKLILLKDGQPLMAPNQSLLKDLSFHDNDMLFALDGMGLVNAANQSRSNPLGMSGPSPSGGRSDNLISGLDFSNILLPGPSSAPGTLSAQNHFGRRPSFEDPETIRQHLLKNPGELAFIQERNPSLANAVQNKDEFVRLINEQRDKSQQHERELLRLRNADPFDPEVQTKIANLIKQKNIDEQLERAMEHQPEFFAQVTMLYINCQVFGHDVKAFVDSGAQMTIMSQACARRCNVDRLIDTRWSGIAKGVGTQKIIGRVHSGQVQIGNDFLESPFSVLEDQTMELLIGLDMLKRHQCCIDLKQNCLIIGTTGTKTTFLPDAELPLYARLNQDFNEAESTEGAKVAPTSPKRAKSAETDKESKITCLMNHGFSRQVCIDTLNQSNGDVDQALATLLTKAFNT